MTTLTVASYNIHKGVGLDRRRDADRIITVLREVNADVFALQEADLRLGERASVLPRALLDDTPWKVVPVAKRPRSIGWHGNALLVRRHIEVLEAHALDLPTLEPRGAAMAVLEAHGVRFCVIGVHLDLSGLRRRDQVRALLRRCDELDHGLPCILMGDFNQWGRQTGAMQEFDLPGEGGWHMAPTGASYPSRRPLAQLDRIICNEGFTVAEARAHHSALATVASDHLPVWARVESTAG
ncbi:endonuclease [Erythrobacteraceae bacterium CFH 75059]|uniref:endonuclease/exonuclease/phosphatase family protein n=1 Tax=Qipengyuania thermophila TaxID=2509361 RepID=UPI00101FE2EF|nr:endonuclease/exonuclease/phosphatase family protein [Qipengyuania thermophila]TCD06826.1 endonuclease [Erythrobacteraceae bacterium CFH 75059]